MRRYLIIFFGVVLITSTSTFGQKVKEITKHPKRPNILFVISDDQSYPHASAYGYGGLQTPNFDRIAKEGALFLNAFSASPGCSPSRASLLTGLNCWQLKEASTHASSFPLEFKTYPELLFENGYEVGLTGKGWGPGNYQVTGRKHNPAGKEYQSKEIKSPDGISTTDYAANFQDFYSQKDPNKPFVFWLGTQEPHRPYRKGIGLENGLDPTKVVVPSFLPDIPEVRSDLLDYFYEIQWFDTQLGKVIHYLEAQNELDNTFIVITSDNGMSFPRAKANVYEYGIHVPLAIRWGKEIPANTTIKEVVSLTDLFATFLEIGGVSSPKRNLESKSLIPLLKGSTTQHREAVFASRERHSSSRYQNAGYPQRAIRTNDYLFIRNYKPDRWPAGDPQELDQNGQLKEYNTAFYDIDEASTNVVIQQRENATVTPYFHLAINKRPYEELYDIKKDPSCLHNLIHRPEYHQIGGTLRNQLNQYLVATKDPRETSSNGDIFETYPRLNGVIRQFPKID